MPAEPARTPAQPARPRPPYLKPLGAPPARVRDDHDLDHDPDRDRRSSSSSSLPLPAPPPSLKKLSDRALARWLERNAAQLTPKGVRHPVEASRSGFHGARSFVLKYGADLIVEAIHELTYWGTLEPREALGRQDSGAWLRFWSDDIVSPARRLNAYVRELHELSRRQDGQP